MTDDEEGLKVESAMAEVITVVSLAAGVYVYWIAIQGEYRPASKNSGTTALVSEEQWRQLRGLSPSCFTAPNTPLLPPFGPGDNEKTGGNRLHAVSRGVPGRILPQDVFDILEFSGSMGGMKVRRAHCALRKTAVSRTDSFGRGGPEWAVTPLLPGAARGGRDAAEGNRFPSAS
jgi:hypothetical protein